MTRLSSIEYSSSMAMMNLCKFRMGTRKWMWRTRLRCWRAKTIPSSSSAVMSRLKIGYSCPDSVVPHRPLHTAIDLQYSYRLEHRANLHHAPGCESGTDKPRGHMRCVSQRECAHGVLVRCQSRPSPACNCPPGRCGMHHSERKTGVVEGVAQHSWPDRPLTPSRLDRPG
jgi:hypothetical protein